MLFSLFKHLSFEFFDYFTSIKMMSIVIPGKQVIPQRTHGDSLNVHLESNVCPFRFCRSEDCLSINRSSFDIINGIYYHLMFEQVQRSCMCLCIFMYVVLYSWASQNLKEINSSISVTVWRTTEYLRSKQSEAETNTLAATSGLVLQPGFHFKMWMDSKLCAVIGAKNTLTHTPRTLYPPDMCSAAFLP